MDPIVAFLGTFYLLAMIGDALEIRGGPALSTCSAASLFEGS
jgi:hypothetical protein